MNKTLWKESSSALRGLLRELGNSSPAVKYKFGAIYHGQSGTWLIYNGLADNIIGRVTLQDDKAVIRYRPASLYAEILKAYRPEGRKRIVIAGTRMNRNRTYARNRLLSRIRPVMEAHRRARRGQPVTEVTANQTETEGIRYEQDGDSVIVTVNRNHLIAGTDLFQEIIRDLQPAETISTTSFRTSVRRATYAAYDYLMQPDRPQSVSFAVANCRVQDINNIVREDLELRMRDYVYGISQGNASSVSNSYRIAFPNIRAFYDAEEDNETEG